MRLLLLLSALFTALSGVAGTCAQAQPVQASRLALSPTEASAAAPAAARFAPPAFGRVPPRQMTRPWRLISAATGRLLYAERRRE